MKELSIEEKAKRYDEAIEKMQSMMKSWETLSYNGKTFLQDIKYIFPELKESEDEKIRKSLIKGFKRYFSESVFNGILVKDILAYLEKQGEKGINGKNREIPFADKVEPKFKVGDFIVNDYCMGRIVEITNDAYLLDTEQGIPFSCHSTRLWDIAKDAKDGDVLCCESGWTCIFKTLVNDETFSSYCFMDKTKWFCETGSECHTLEKEFVKSYNGKIYPATKEQRDQLEKAMADAGYTFDFEKKELKKIEQKPAWSEEDEKYWSIVIAEFSKCAGKFVSKDEWMRCNDWLNSLKDRIQPQHKQEWSERDELMLGKCINAVSGYYSPEDKQSMKDWLYFLKQRHTWNPSDEQMKALWVTFMGGEEQAALASLYNDLKKLK